MDGAVPLSACFSGVAGVVAVVAVVWAAAVAAGFGAGAAHALLGPDHLAAVAPLSLERGRGAGWIGLRWGLGHAVGALLLGVAAVTLRDAIPWQGLSAWAERAVGALLIGLGLWTIRRATRTVLHAHAHGHTPSLGEAPPRHAHVHAHPLGAGHDPGRPSSGVHRHEHAALGIGFVHGLAGFGHLWAALPALALPRVEATLYLAAYGLGTLAAMSLFSSILGRFGTRASATGTRILRGAMATAGLVAVSVGIWWMWGGGA